MKDFTTRNQRLNKDFTFIQAFLTLVVLMSILIVTILLAPDYNPPVSQEQIDYINWTNQ
jgi:hypothetical protein